eukprot:TRINITY_DN6949_c2_g1_i1.p1 TRINITY_DN6949_c2_g1~~TRINITY_DN6949_c2_g1_i1.p1  ORF type:complete len:900 (-),score=121.91 TRINITY_DN6949_c2_g1_i1:88-2787(-)
MANSGSPVLRRGNSTASIQSASGRRKSRTRKASAWSAAAVGKDALGEDVGVAFCTRAEVQSASAFLHDTKKAGVQAALAKLKVWNPFPKGQPTFQPTCTVTYAYSTRLRLPRFSSSSSVAYQLNFFLEVSSALSCAYILAWLALEPACISEKDGSAIDRLGQSVSGVGGSGLLACFHVVNAVLYTVLAFGGRAVVGRLDPKLRDELSSLQDAVRSYARSVGFWADCVMLPGFFAEIVHLFEPPRGGVPSLSQWIMLFQLAKAWRSLAPEGLAVGMWDNFAQGLLRILASLAFWAHTQSCILLAVGNQEKALGQISWLDQLPGEGSCQSLYIEAVYFAILSVTSVGYGDSLLTSTERAVNCVNMLLSFIFTAKVCADLTWLTSTHNHWQAHHQAIRTQTRVALNQMRVPCNLADRVLAYQNYVAMVHTEDLAQPAFKGLSENLMKELSLCAYRGLVMQAPFLREQPKDVIMLMVNALKDQVYLPADLIVCAGFKGRDLYFVRRGRAAVFLGPDEAPKWGISEEVASYGAGNYFGELAMLTGKPRAAWVMAKTYCVCSVLPHSAIEKLGEECPKAFTRLVQAMVRVYKLNAQTTWDDVTKRLVERGIVDAEDAYQWFCEKGERPEEEELTAKAFTEGMQRLKVPELDYKIFWAEMDNDNSGIVDIEEFCQKMKFVEDTSCDLVIQEYPAASVEPVAEDVPTPPHFGSGNRSIRNSLRPSYSRQRRLRAQTTDSFSSASLSEAADSVLIGAAEKLATTIAQQRVRNSLDVGLDSAAIRSMAQAWPSQVQSPPCGRSDGTGPTTDAAGKQGLLQEEVLEILRTVAASVERVERATVSAVPSLAVPVVGRPTPENEEGQQSPPRRRRWSWPLFESVELATCVAASQPSQSVRSAIPERPSVELT